MPRVTMGYFGHIDLAGPTHRIRAGDREWLFEFAPGGGLAVMDEHENHLPDPPEDSPFWRAVELWERQGRVIGPDGYCVYGPAPKLRYRLISGRNYIQMRPDEPDDDDTIYVDAY